MSDKYTRQDFIRVMNALYESGLAGFMCPGLTSKDEFFNKLGSACQLDLSTHSEELKEARASGSIARELRVFEDMITVAVESYMRSIR